VQPAPESTATYVIKNPAAFFAAVNVLLKVVCSTHHLVSARKQSYCVSPTFLVRPKRRTFTKDPPL
jgi:hypothetical protein